jgi:hypothetical protein
MHLSHVFIKERPAFESQTVIITVLASPGYSNAVFFPFPLTPEGFGATVAAEQ